MVEIVPSIFKDKNEIGDFFWMINSENYNNCLFIFNDNEEEHDTSNKGGGNAIIRPYNKYSGKAIRSAGIPTGCRYTFGGYPELNKHVISEIDSAIEEIKQLLNTGNYTTVYYSIDKKDQLLGMSIFKIGEDVRKYITEKIESLKR
jgi:hypothetical protein